MILPLDADVTLDDGAKGANLARLVRAGLPVPRGFIVTTEAYRHYVSANDLDAWVLDVARAARFAEPASVDAASAEIRTRFDSGSISSELVDAIRIAYGALGRPPAAVRSSATTEDLPDFSFAGQQDTMLNRRGHDTSAAWIGALVADMRVYALAGAGARGAGSKNSWST